MAQSPGPLPPPSTPWVGQSGAPSLVFRQYFPTLDAAVRGLMGFFGSATFQTTPPPGMTPAPPTLIAVASPSNANAVKAGVAVGQLYCDAGDPCTVYIRTA
jgi:hypothetical protein